MKGEPLNFESARGLAQSKTLTRHLRLQKSPTGFGVRWSSTAFFHALGLSIGVALLSGCATYHSQPILPEKSAATFNARSLDDPGLRAFLETNHVTIPSPGKPWSLKALTLVAFYYQPALAEARAQLLVAQAAQITAGERPNPSVSVTPGYDSGIPDNPSPWLVPVSIDWPIETAGKRGKRIAQSEHLAEAARWNLVGTVWQVRSRVRTTLLNLYAARETESLLARQESAQSNVVHLLEGQLAAGSVSSYEVTQARIALDTTRMAWQQAIGQYRQARLQLAGALGVPLRALNGIRLSFSGLNEFPRELTEPEVRRQALLNRADVRSALAEYAASQSALQLEVANQYPDLHLGPGYAWNAGSAGDSEWDLGVTLTLPILNQNQGPIAEAEAKRKAVAAHFLTIQSQAIGEIESALIGYRAALQQTAAAGALQINLRRRLDSIRAQVQAGEVEPLSLANAEVEFDTGAQSRLTALVQAQQALGQLEDAVQSPLTLPPATLNAAENNAGSQ
jgi:outer membrane protein, heavy metal efflux system